MRISLLKYLAFLMIGIAIGIYGYGDYTQRETFDIEKFATAQTQDKEIPKVFEELPSGPGEPYLEIVRKQDEEIAHLKAEVAQMKTAAQKPASENSQYEPMQIMSFEEMTDSLQETLRNQFRNRIFIVPEKMMRQLKEEFLEESYSTWGMEYQDKILDFFVTADAENQYYLQNIECKTKICRLEVNTENGAVWRQIYSSMTHQDWYSSITFQEESDYPGTVIYYLMRDEDFGG